MKGFVYILQGSNKDKFYIGSTSDITRRIKQHTNGHTQTTRNMGKIDLVLVQEYNNLEIARKIERKIKKLKRKDYIQKIADISDLETEKINQGYKIFIKDNKLSFKKLKGKNES